MAKTFDALPGGRVKQFRNRQRRCSCSKKTPGRPGLTRGLCHGGGRRPSRLDRRRAAEELRRVRTEGCGLDP